MESGVEIQNCWFHEKKSNGAVYYLYKITIGSVMKKLISKLQKIELELSKEYGELRLFAFFFQKNLQTDGTFLYRQNGLMMIDIQV